MPSSRTSLGNRGEALAQQLLRDKGYKILSTNYRCSWGEVDIIAQYGPEVVFVEVRTRRGEGYGSPEESITPEKIRRLMAASQHYLQASGLGEAQWRIDLVSVRLNNRGGLLRMDHLTNAVQL